MADYTAGDARAFGEDDTGDEDSRSRVACGALEYVSGELWARDTFCGVDVTVDGMDADSEDIDGCV